MYTRDFDDAFVAVFNELTDRVAERVINAIRTVTSFPGLARDYMPYNMEQKPDMPIRHYPVPRTYLAIFFEVDESHQLIKFLRLIDVRRDPMHIFEDLSNIKS